MRCCDVIDMRTGGGGGAKRVENGEGGVVKSMELFPAAVLSRVFLSIAEQAERTSIFLAISRCRHSHRLKAHGVIFFF